ncbi:class I SAM-dependent methyltransferase [Candidatus Parcubacteria bacterium]|nr:class I SAM-dependent methyltransferase [Candidatus Parcubacteria bacterium]
MQDQAYDKTYELENRYWWHVGRRYVFRKVLERFFSPRTGAKIVDIGCGTGGNFPMLGGFGTVLGLDISEKALAFCRQKGFTNVALMRGVYDTGLDVGSVDLVTMFDVLEHFDDDVRALAEINRILKPGGYTLISVPAFKTLWSELDEALYHRRRYKRRELEMRLEKTGFEIVKSSYLFFFVFPLVFMYRVVGQFQERRSYPQFTYVEFPKFIGAFLAWLSKVEASILGAGGRLPVGSTVVCFARKKI